MARARVGPLAATIDRFLSKFTQGLLPKLWQRDVRLTLRRLLREERDQLELIEAQIYEQEPDHVKAAYAAGLQALGKIMADTTKSGIRSDFGSRAHFEENSRDKLSDISIWDLGNIESVLSQMTNFPRDVEEKIGELLRERNVADSAKNRYAVRELILHAKRRVIDEARHDHHDPDARWKKVSAGLDALLAGDMCQDEAKTIRSRI